MNPAPHPHPTSAVQQIRGWRFALLFPFGLLLRAWGASLRLEASPDSLRALTAIDEPTALVIWHNRLFLSSEIVRRYRQQRPTHALVSASKDGAWLSAFFSLVRMRTVRGSSSRLGREAVTALLEVMRAGHDIGITPDGPRGPIYEFKAGGLIVARRAHAPLLLIGGTFESAWRLRSWDRFYLPRPFSRVHMVGEIISTAQLDDRDAAAQRLGARMMAINHDHPTAPPVI